MILNFLKPRREKLNTFLSIGIPLIALSFIDFFSSSFLFYDAGAVEVTSTETPSWTVVSTGVSTVISTTFSTSTS